MNALKTKIQFICEKSNASGHKATCKKQRLKLKGAAQAQTKEDPLTGRSYSNFTNASLFKYHS